MAGYTLRRLGTGLVTLFLYVSLLFFLVSAILPGDWTSQFILSAEARAALQEQVGLDRSIWAQYFDWVKGALTLDLGTSFSGPSVWEMISSSLPSTLFVLLMGLVAAFVLGGWIGRATAYTDNAVASGVITFISVVFLAAFPPAVAFALERGGRNLLSYDTYSRIVGYDDEIWNLSDMSPPQVMWRMFFVVALVMVLVWVLGQVARRFGRLRIPGWASAVAMLGVTLLAWNRMGLSGRAFDITLGLSALIVGVVILTFGEVILVTRAAMEDSLHEDYVMVARAKGLPDRRVRDHHAARTALLPVLSRFVVSVPYFFTGLVILESVFAGTGSGAIGYRPGHGMGSLLFDAVRLQDTAVVIGGLLVVGVITLLLRIALDVTHAALDPRIHFGGEPDVR